MFYKTEKDGKIIMLSVEDIAPCPLTGETVTEITEGEYTALRAESKERAETIADYVSKVLGGTTSDVPEEYRSEVEAELDIIQNPVTRENQYELGYQQAILDLIELGVMK